jgi:hypothetical protein
MENETKTPCCGGDPEGDSPASQWAERMVTGKPTAKDYLIATGLVIGALGEMAFDFIKDPRGYIDKWSDDFAEATDEWIEKRL